MAPFSRLCQHAPSFGAHSLKKSARLIVRAFSIVAVNVKRRSSLVAGAVSHVQELTGSTQIFNECDSCHNHRFCTVTGEAMYFPGNRDHFHEVKFHTDFSDKHFHEFCGRTTGSIDFKCR